MDPKIKATLIAQWTAINGEHRLVLSGSTLTIEREDVDALGGKRWLMWLTWEHGRGCGDRIAMTLLADGMADLAKRIAALENRITEYRMSASHGPRWG